VRMSSVILPDPELAVKPALSDEEKQARLTAEIEKSEKLAASQLHMAEWFLSQGKNDIAKRRLQLLIETLPRSEASDTARKLLEGL
jgi:TolA-binding protein